MGMLSFYCGYCGSLLKVEAQQGLQSRACPSCQSTMQWEAFPAAVAELKGGQVGKDVMLEQESSCFEHPGKQAVHTCAGCGKFMCTLCDIEWGDQHLCSTCIANPPDQELKKAKPDHRYFHYDSMALMLALSTIPMYILSFIMAPLTLCMCVFYWKKLPPSPRSKVRFIAASIIALGFLALIIGVIFTWA